MHFDHAGPEEIADAVRALRSGGVVAFPTETVYGLGADALDEQAVRRVFEIKQRPANNPLIVHVADEAMARAFADAWSDEASKLARAFWPGPLTIVLPKATQVPGVVAADGPTVALRCPDHRVALALIDAFGSGLVAPSANPSGSVSPTRAEHVREAFPDLPVLDGGACRVGIESTVLTLDPEPTILRLGAIGADAIGEVLGKPVLAARHDADTPARSPGRIGPHYRPRTPVVLFEPGETPDVNAAVLAITPIDPEPARLIRMPGDASGYAARLYAALREADATGAPLIAVERPAVTGPDPESSAVWAAIRERLERASKRG